MSIAKLHMAARSHMNALLQPHKMQQSDVFSVAAQAGHLRATHDTLSHAYSAEAPSACMTIKPQQYMNDKSLSSLDALVDYVRSEFRQFASHALLQGSFATDDYVDGWSDVDMMVIINDVVLDDVMAIDTLKQKLCTLRNVYMYDVDPLQHHGVLLVTEKELGFYADAVMPHALLNDSVELFKDAAAFDVCVRDDAACDASSVFAYAAQTIIDAQAAGVMHHHERAGLALASDFSETNERTTYQNSGMYQLKYLLSLVMLLPALRYNAAGMSPKKGDAIRAVMRLCDDEQMSVLRAASELRMAWDIPSRSPALFRIAASNEIPVRVREVVGDGYFERSLRFVEALRALDDGEMRLALQQECAQ